MKITDKMIYKTLKHSLSAQASYDYFTTKDGLKAFFGADNEIDITPGGKYEIYFLMDNEPGLKGGEGCQVLSFVPGKMLSFTWNAPPQHMEVRNSDYHTWVVLDFQDGFIELRHLGWPEDPKWALVYDYFDRAWDIVLDNFSKLSR
jgi:uncharacterized protein YndB with AHSA1/START domain